MKSTQMTHDLIEVIMVLNASSKEMVALMEQVVVGSVVTGYSLRALLDH